MLSCLALLAALSLAPEQSGQLALTNARLTYGILGPTRSSDQFLHGDDLTFSFDIEGAKVGAGGKVSYSTALEVSDSKGKVLFRQAPNSNEVPVAPGAKAIPACAQLHIGLDQPPGEYKLKVVVTDRSTGASQELSRGCKLLPKEFGLVRVTTTLDQEAKMPAAVLAKGKPAWIHFAAIGFARDKTKTQPHVTVSMQVRDEKGGSALPKPSTGTVNQDVAEKEPLLPMQFELVLQQPGNYTVELSATDEITQKKTMVTFPIRVGGN